MSTDNLRTQREMDAERAGELPDVMRSTRTGYRTFEEAELLGAYPLARLWGDPARLPVDVPAEAAQKRWFNEHEQLPLSDSESERRELVRRDSERLHLEGIFDRMGDAVPGGRPFPCDRHAVKIVWQVD